jgi:UDP-glucose 4-epimerase
VAVGGEVTSVDNLVNGKRENLADLPAERFRLEVVDVRDGERMSGLLTKAELVLHLACLGVHHSIHSPLENHEVNATATLNCISGTRSTRRYLVERSGFSVRCRQAAIIFSLVIGIASRNVCIGVLPKHQCP